MMIDDSFRIEVAYALPNEQVILTLEGSTGITLREAVERSGITDQFPDIDLDNAKVGIFGKLAKLDTRLNPGDRVEIYRPLIADPKEMRRKRAEKGKQMKKGSSKTGS